MAKAFRALAIDIGASNGRAILGTLAGDGKLTLEEVRRFPNGMAETDGHLRWDFERLRKEVTAAVEDAMKSENKPASVGVDTWGVDYVLIDKAGKLIEQPIAYRDRRTDETMHRFFDEVMSEGELYSKTGIQFLQFNTLFQLASEIWSGEGRLDKADKLLMMPDAFTFMLSGKKVAEYTVASTTQMLDAKTCDWSPEILESLRIRRGLLPDIVPPGTKAGKYKSANGKIDVVAPAGHDTGAAVAAVPAEDGKPWAYISSGTWSLVGVETKQPFLSDASREAGLTNEGGVEGTYRLLTNVMGLWLIQECLRMWQKRGMKIDIAEVCKAAASAPADGPLIDPDNERFFLPKDMLEEIAGYCKGEGQKLSDDVGAVARCVFESLALKTRLVFERIAEVTGTAPEVIHMVGGGSRNALLCSMTASACGVPVVGGPAEATATGNFITQAMAEGRLKNLAEGRKMARDSFELARYEPSSEAAWQRRYNAFRELLG